MIVIADGHRLHYPNEKRRGGGGQHALLIHGGGFQTGGGTDLTGKRGGLGQRRAAEIRHPLCRKPAGIREHNKNKHNAQGAPQYLGKPASNMFHGAPPTRVCTHTSRGMTAYFASNTPKASTPKPIKNDRALEERRRERPGAGRCSVRIFCVTSFSECL